MTRSALDQMAIGAVVIAGLVEAAQAALTNAPKVRSAFPVLNLGGFWNYVPLAFIAIAAALWVAERFVRFRNAHAGSQPSPEKVSSPRASADHSGWQLVAIAAMPVIGLIALAMTHTGSHDPAPRQITKPAPTAESEPTKAEYQPVLQGPVTLAFLERTLRNHDPVMAERLLRKYLGAPMIVSGKIQEISSQSADDTYTFYLTDSAKVPVIYMIFDSTRNDGLQYYYPGNHIEGVCRIERLDGTGVGLHHCTLMKGGVVSPSR